MTIRVLNFFLVYMRVQSYRHVHVGWMGKQKGYPSREVGLDPGLGTLHGRETQIADRVDIVVC